MQPTQSRCHQHQPAGGGPSSGSPPLPPEPLALQNLACFDTSQPLATQTSGSYYSTERATKRHFHNETSQFASVLPRRALVPTCGVCPTCAPRPTTTRSTTTPVIGQNCAVGVVNAEMQKMSWPETLFLSRKQPPGCYFLITKGSGVPAITLAFAERSTIFAHFLFFITFSEAIPLVGRRRNNAWS